MRPRITWHGKAFGWQCRSNWMFGWGDTVCEAYKAWRAARLMPFRSRTHDRGWL